jgi:hypothetical protein
MELMTAGEVIDRVAEVGGRLEMEGERVRLTLPGDCPPETESMIVETVRTNRDAVAAILQDMASKAPSLEEVKAGLPPGIRVVSYVPKEAPFAVAPVSVVTQAGKFYRAYLADLARRLEKPEGYHCPPLSDILSKLADAGLELAVDAPATVRESTWR